MAKHKFIIRWHITDERTINLIKLRFGMPDYFTLNRHTPVEIDEKDIPEFEETARRGFYGIIREKWHKNGGHYIFNHR